MNVAECFDTPVCGYDAVVGYTYDETAAYNCDEYQIGFDKETNLRYVVQVRRADVQHMRTMYPPDFSSRCNSSSLRDWASSSRSLKDLKP